MTDQRYVYGAHRADDLQQGVRGPRSARGLRSNPAVVTSVVGAIATILTAVIAGVFALLAKDEPAQPAPPAPTVIRPQSPDGSRRSASFEPTSEEPAPPMVDTTAGDVPEERVGRWRGAVGYEFAKIPMDIKIGQAEVGDTVGSMSYEVSGFGTCSFTLVLLDAGTDFLEFQAKKAKGPYVCSDIPLIRLDFDGPDTAQYTEGGMPPRSTLHHSAG